MGWQTPLTGEVRMSAEAARQLLELKPVDWYAPGQTFGEYLGGGVAFDESRSTLRFDLGFVTWWLRKMMHLIAAMKDLGGTDMLVHHAPTYDAWYETGTFFIEMGRWSYVGAGPMFSLASWGFDEPAHVGPDVPTVEHVHTWNEVGPLARAACLSSDRLWLEIEAVRGPTFRCGIWDLPDSMPWTDDVLTTMAIADGGANLVFTSEGRERVVAVNDLYTARERADA